MSLNRWLRDYLFIPLARSPLRPPLLLVVFFVFLVSGIWHGSTLNFLLMGAYFGGIYVSYAGMKKFLRKESLIPSSVLSRFLVIQMFVGGMVFFRSKNLPHLFSLLKSACLGPNSQTVIYDTFLHILPYVLVTIALEWLLQAPVKIRNPWRRVSVSVGLSLVLVFGYHEVQPFIYFIF